MPTKPCPEAAGSQIIAQTLFLGASVGSFNTSMGWGGQPSQLTVTLIEDSVSDKCLLMGQGQGGGSEAKVAAQFPLGPNEDGTLKAAPAITFDRFNPDHYHSCVGDSCYINNKGNAFNSQTMDVSERMVPAKVYYEFIADSTSLPSFNPDPTASVTNLKKSFRSRYWYSPDPGFFGQPNRIFPDSTYKNGYSLSDRTQSNFLNKGYDIIDTPVFFKMGNFTFGGLVQSWTRQVGQGGRTYSVVINSIQSLLNNCYVILGGYSGAVYSKLAGSTPQTSALNNNSLFGGPRNYTGSLGVDYFGKIYEGNLPNVFNVYGFLESFGRDGFGGSNTNTEGISVNNIMDALSVLTGSVTAQSSGSRLLTYQNTEPSFKDYGPRTAFSPFGRILAKTMQENDTYIPISNTFTKFGVIPPTPVINDLSGSSRCQFVLDLSEIPRLPNDFRLSGPVMTITDLLNEIGKQAGFDYYADLIPITANSTFYNVIKIKVISRLAQPRTNIIENTIKNLECNGYALNSITVGKEKNEQSARAVIIGGPVQRLYQAKSLRLAYTQSNYIFNPSTGDFIDYMQLGKIPDQFTSGVQAQSITRQFHFGKTRVPSAIDLHNPQLSSIINPTYKGIYTHNDEIKEKIGSFLFTEPDTDWNDSSQLGTGINAKESGNYFKAKILKQETNELSKWGVAYNQRYFPLWKDVICPFFGFVQDNELDVKIDGSNNDFRRVRPVWFDTWTGQIVVLLQVRELPETSVNLTGFFDMSRTVSDVLGNRTISSSYFMLTESEIRAALQGFEEFLVYSMAKTYSNDLIEMVRRAYIIKDAAVYERDGLSQNEALEKAREKHDWFWRLANQKNNVPGGNIAGAFRQPIAPPVPAQAQGVYNIDKNVLNDLRILHSFVQKIAEFYGKKYMVVAPYLAAYKENNFGRIALPTSAGTAYIFSGGGDLKYSYNPTNDGAWEEYGNIIDDCIAVGGKDWYNLSDDVGKISPILAYNANDNIDLIKNNMCLMTQNNFNFVSTNKISPFWNFKAWDIMKDKRDATCEGKYIFPSIDYSSLQSSDYILVNVSGHNGALPPPYDQSDPNLTTIQPFKPADMAYNFVPAKSRDAFGTELVSPLKKLFIKTTVDEKFIFLDPENFQEPRILINSPGIKLNNITQETVSDPTRTILANIAIEDVAIYIRSTAHGQRDINWINYMMSYVYSVIVKGVVGSAQTFMVSGSEGSSANKSASYPQLSPKMAHPFFAGIPLKSNVHNYGPWTNYPYLEYLNDPESVFPSGIIISTSDAIPPVCSGTPVVVNQDMAKRAIDNWILSTEIVPMENYVPWNYGGMAYLDNIAHNDVRSRTNYQNVLETAMIDMPGLPLFNLGGSFTYGSFAYLPTGVKTQEYIYEDVKTNLSNPLPTLPVDLPVLYAPLIPTTTTDELKYNVINIPLDTNYGTPVITNIQTNISQGGITTTYSFRTYTRKLGFFNREYSEIIKKSNLDTLRRNKQLADASRQITNNIFTQQQLIQQQRLEKQGSVDVRSKLFGWSPVKILIGQSSPYLEMPYYDNIQRQGRITNLPSGSTRPSEVQTKHKIRYGDDPGHDVKTWNSETKYLETTVVVPKLSENIRHRTDVGLFEEKEAIAQIQQDYGLQGMMSLDGIFSPVSFYPTFKNSTYHFTLYDTDKCPFCKGTKRINITYQSPLKDNFQTPITVDIYCDKCKSPEDRLNFSLKSNTTSKSASQSLETLPPYIVTSGTDLSTLLEYGINKNQTSLSVSSSSSSTGGQAGVSIPINMVSLQPIVVPYGEFKNTNIQAYKGIHPEGIDIHGDLSIGAYSSDRPRTFYDRCRHSIEIVGRGSMIPSNISTSYSLLDASGNQYFNNKQPSPNQLIVNTDYYDKDVKLQQHLKDRGDPNAPLYSNNQRFLGLRGPLVLHAWGYDLEGYPVPNAADEPYEFDTHGRPKRFKVKITEGFPKSVKFKDLKIGDTYKYNNIEYVKEKNLSDNEILVLGPNNNITNSTDVSHISYEDDLSNEGGFDPAASAAIGDRLAGFRGSVISKTQKWDPVAKKWSEKKKLKEFYLNWAERTDLWPVGPIDLSWDPDRKVWATKSDTSSSIYKMVYVTLEEDLVKEEDYDETYPARAFLDDVEYSNQPLPDGFRRLVFVKDRGGYTAPRGAKLLCRYSSDSGFYEPISKQSFVVGGLLGIGNSATIEMSYISGRKRGEPVPTMLVNFSNPFDFNTISGNRGLFTFINGKWTLTATKEVS